MGAFIEKIKEHFSIICSCSYYEEITNITELDIRRAANTNRNNIAFNNGNKHNIENIIFIKKT